MKSFYTLGGIILVSVGVCGCKRAANSAPPTPTAKYNVILISIDTLRADRLGTYGFKDWNISPHIDAIADRSVVFTSAFSTASITTASHMSMFTGLYPIEHRLTDPPLDISRSEILPASLDEKIRTLPQILQANGFKTARFVYSRDYFLDPSIGFGRGFDQLFPYGMDSHSAAKAIGDWFGQNSSSRFFVFIHSKRPHAPYVFSDQFVKNAETAHLLDAKYRGPVTASLPKFESGLQKNPEFISPIPGLVPDGLYFLNLVRKNNKEDRRRIEQLYNLAVNLTDDFLGNIFSKLDELKLMNNTIIVLTSDHGEQFMEHGSLHHTHLNFEETHVPLLILLPPAEMAKRKVAKVAALVQSIDILPTVLALLGLPTPQYVSGQDLAKLWSGSAEKVHDEAYGFNINRRYENAQYVRSPDWTLVVHGQDVQELYDRKKDPMELTNVSSSQPQIVEEMRLKLKKMELKAYAFDPGAAHQ